MKRQISLEARGALIAVAAGVITLSFTLGVSLLLHGTTGRRAAAYGPPPVSVPLSAAELPAHLLRGHLLFTQECTSCHGNHAQGGIGPDLRHLTLSEAQFEATVQVGIKPVMPAFGGKYSHADIHAVAVYVRSSPQ